MYEILISVDELQAIIDDPSVSIVDCRFNLLQPAAGRELYLAGHVPGAVYADLDRDLAGAVSSSKGRHPLPKPDDFADLLGRLGIDNTSDVVVYDDASGALAARLWWLLRWAGHDAVRLLDGGMSKWLASDLAVEKGESVMTATKFDVRPQPDWVLETAEIVAAGQDVAGLQLVDARDAARFRGEVEPIDAVAGHIPGALSLPFSSSLNDDGTWKAADELQRMWRDLLGDGVDRPWSVMCGSGVTACHLVVSGLLAGLPEPRVYIGSWSEWITDPERPVA